ncbi:MAG: peptide chain release factor-like protein [Desulfuromonadaceae bacterium]|nr:peptide chain release factor-like protein [Desulfuromonadaceae bacterium]
MTLEKTIISAAKQEELLRRMASLDIREADLEEKFVLGSGRGGQKVNKSSTCVFLRHLPTGIEVKCQRERSRALNRFFARRLLCDKIEEVTAGGDSPRQQEIERIRRNKSRRRRRALGKTDLSESE